MMSAPTVKPALPSAGAQAPKVSPGAPPPPATANNPHPQPTGSSASKPIGLGMPSTTGSPSKPTTPVNINHAQSAIMPLPLSLIQEHKPPSSSLNQQQMPIGLARPLDHKEYPFSPSPVVKPTSNGVEGSPTKSSPIAQHPPSEIKKAEEKSPASAVPNHSAEPIKPTTPAPPAPQIHAISPPAPLNPLIPSAPLVAAAASEAVPTNVLKQDAGNTAITTNHASNVIKLETLPKPDVITTKPQTETVAVAQSTLPPSSVVTPPASAPAPAPPATPQPVLEMPVKQAPAEVAKAGIRTEPTPKPEFKVATPPRNSKRKKEVKVTPEAKTSSEEDDRKSKRVRIRTQPYQSPIPELTYMAKLKTLMKSPDDKLIVFYKNEFLAVRNSEGSFYVCQAMQNIYKSSLRIRIRWLSQEKKDSKATDVYIPDFYDATDFDCILTNLELKKLDKNKYQLPTVERERTQNILKRALDVEKGVSEKSPVTEEHPDGLDLSLFRDESQLKKRKSVKRGGKKRAGTTKEVESDSEDDESEEESTDESVEEAKKPIKLNIKRVEKPKTPIKVQTKEPEKKVERVSEREKRGTTSKRRSEPILPVPASSSSRAVAAPRPPPEKKVKAPPKPAAKKGTDPKPEPTLSTRSTKTRSARTTVPVKSLPPTRTKEREVRKAAAPTSGRKKPASKKT